jgi:hypothetical protein
MLYTDELILLIKYVMFDLGLGLAIVIVVLVIGYLAYQVDNDEDIFQGIKDWYNLKEDEDEDEDEDQRNL